MNATGLRLIWAVARRDLGAQFHSIGGFVVFAVLLALQGVAFNAFVLGRGPQPSTELLRSFFYGGFGFCCVASVLFTMRSFAEERQSGTELILECAQLGPWQQVLGKYLAAVVMMGLLLLSSIYIPALLFINGKLSLAHLGVGYFGLFLLAMACCAIGVFASACVRSQLSAAIVAGLVISLLIIAWMLARIVDPPFSVLFAHMSLFQRHFVGFRDGRLASESVIYLLTLAAMFLTLGSAVLAGRRWR